MSLEDKSYTTQNFIQEIILAKSEIQAGLGLFGDIDEIASKIED